MTAGVYFRWLLGGTTTLTKNYHVLCAIPYTNIIHLKENSSRNSKMALKLSMSVTGMGFTRTTEPILGLLVLILMQFSFWIQMAMKIWISIFFFFFKSWLFELSQNHASFNVEKCQHFVFLTQNIKCQLMNQILALFWIPILIIWIFSFS